MSTNYTPENEELPEARGFIMRAERATDKGDFDRADTYALIAIAKSLAVIADKLEYTHPPSYHTADEEG